MEALIPLLLKLLPANFAAIKYLQFVPDAVAVVKELIESSQRIVAFLKQPGMLDEAGRAKLDATIQAHTDEDWWIPDPSIEPPHLPTK